MLGRRPAATAQPERTGDGAGDRQGSERSAQQLHVGLTRIELVTSSLSGMRSNQLSYSPESVSGTQILLALTVTLNRAHNNLFFQHGHTNATHKIGDQVENGGCQNPESGRQHHTQQSQNHDIDKQLPTFEFK